jgi:uncharacterized protein with gpF-like domain
MTTAAELFRDRDLNPGNVPAEVLAYWRRKGLQVGFDYRDVWRSEHHYAFTAAKIMRLDVLEAMREELERAFENGHTFETFRKNLEPRARELGWWGEHEVEDPQTGKVVKVNPPNRLRLIYQTNMRTARAVGQWERIQRSVKSRPYLLYEVGPSARHRDQHLAWHGTLLPADDPFWQVAFPPNGWGCKCRVRAVSKREASELEDTGVLAPDAEPVLDPETGLPTGHRKDTRVPVVRTAPELPLVPWHNKRTGVIEFVPKGIDPGFDRPPAVARDEALAAE